MHEITRVLNTQRRVCVFWKGCIQRGNGKGWTIWARVASLAEGSARQWAGSAGKRKSQCIAAEARGRISALQTLPLFWAFIMICNLANALFKITQDVFSRGSSDVFFFLCDVTLILVDLLLLHPPSLSCFLYCIQHWFANGFRIRNLDSPGRIWNYRSSERVAVNGGHNFVSIKSVWIL